MKKFLAAILAGSLFFMPTAHAEIKTYTGEGTYVMSEGENLGVAKDRAKMDALRNAQEKAGIYIRSYSKMKNFELIDDEVLAIASNIVKLVQDPQYYPLEAVANLEGVLVKVTIVANIDSDDLNKWLGKGDDEKQMLIAQNRDLRQQLDAQAKELAELKRKMTAGADKEVVAQKFADEEKIFMSTQKVDEAWKFYGRGDYSGAVRLHDEAIELNPQNARAWYGRGTAYNELKLYKLSLPDFNKAIGLNPNYADAYNNRGNAYQDLKQYDRAIQNYDKAIQLNPNYVNACNGRGNVYDPLNEYQKAIADYDKAIELEPNGAALYCNRGNTLRKFGQYDKAVADCTKAIELQANFARAYNTRGLCYHEGLKKYDKAIADYKAAIKIDSNFKYAYANLAGVYTLQKNYKLALQNFDMAIKVAPDHAYAYWNRGKCYEAMGDNSKAQADFAKSKKPGYSE